LLRHAVLGAGGVGGFLGAALARAGREVVLLLRPETHARYDGRVQVESAVLGDFEVEVPAATMLDRAVDVLWVTPKATQLDAALELVPDELDDATVVPLLNGLDHVPLLRARFGETSVVPGGAYIESERADVGRIRQKSAFAHIELAPGPGAESVCTELVDAGLSCAVGASEGGVLWRKLATLAPVALTTTALQAPLSAVLADPAWRARIESCLGELAAVATLEGAEVDVEATLEAYERAGDLRSSMQKDRAAGLPLELDAIGGAALRAASGYGVDAPATRELVGLISAGLPLDSGPPLRRDRPGDSADA
jgi:2-dehydropantoate 2-reductase